MTLVNWGSGFAQRREGAKIRKTAGGPCFSLRLRVSAQILIAALLVGAPAHADTLIDNVNGLTLNADGAIERFSGILIGDDGRIEQVLARSDKRPGKVDYKLDAKGRVLMPGLIASHVDLMELGLSQLTGADAPPEARPRPEDLDLAFLKAQQSLLSRGITAAADMGTTIEDWQAYRRAGDLGGLRMRIVAYAEGADAMILIGGPGPSTWLYNDRLRLNGVRLSLNQAPAAHARLSDTQLKNLMSRAAMDNFQVAVEAGGENAVAGTLDAIEDLAPTYRGERRWRIEDADAIAPADLPRVARSGVIASVRPPAGSPDGLAGLAAAIAQGQTREAALAAYTTGAAYAAFAEGRFGRIARGQRADFLLLDTDPLLAPIDELRNLRVAETWVGGQRVYQAAAGVTAPEGR